MSGPQDLTTLDENYPKGNIETVSTLDNYQRETRAKLKAWAAVEHDPATGHHRLSIAPAYPSPGRMYYDRITGELRTYIGASVAPPFAAWWRAPIQPPWNYVFNPEAKMMLDAYNSVPCGWIWSGLPGQVVFRDTFSFLGKTSFALTTPAGGGPTDYHVLRQAMSSSNPRFLPIDYWRGRTISFGCYVISELANKAYIQLNDGIQNVAALAQTSGTSAWDWIQCTMTVSSGATDLFMDLACLPSTSPLYVSRFCMPTMVEGSWCPRPTMQSHPQRSHVLQFGGVSGALQAMTGTRYYGPCGRSGNEFLASMIIPYRFNARNLSVAINPAPGAGQQVDFKIRYNNTTDSSLGCSIAGTNTTGADDTFSLTGGAGGTISLRSIGSAAPAAAQVLATLYVDELPW